MTIRVLINQLNWMKKMVSKAEGEDLTAACNLLEKFPPLEEVENMIKKLEENPDLLTK